MSWESILPITMFTARYLELHIRYKVLCLTKYTTLQHAMSLVQNGSTHGHSTSLTKDGEQTLLTTLTLSIILPY